MGLPPPKKKEEKKRKKEKKFKDLTILLMFDSNAGKGGENMYFTIKQNDNRDWMCFTDIGFSPGVLFQYV